jgi:hypothetical protein
MVLMKTLDINAIPENVTLIESSLVLKIEIGVGLNVFPNDGFVMAILIVLMEPTKIPLFMHVHLLSLVNLINSNVTTEDASIETGSVIMTTIVETDLMNRRTVPSEPVRLTNSPAQTQNVSRKHISAMEKMTVVMVLMKQCLNVRQK